MWLNGPTAVVEFYFQPILKIASDRSVKKLKVFDRKNGYLRRDAPGHIVVFISSFFVGRKMTHLNFLELDYLLLAVLIAAKLVQG